MDALRRVPSDDGFKCTYAASVSHAIEMLKYLVPDHIFSYFNIPCMNGLDLLQYIRDQHRLSNAQLCLYSGHISEEVRAKAGLTGITCLQKTATIDSLARSLSDLFTMKKQSQAWLGYKLWITMHIMIDQLQQEIELKWFFNVRIGPALLR